MFLTPRITTLSRAVAQTCDPYWDQVVLAMHMDDFTDLKGHSVAATGDVSIVDNPSAHGGRLLEINKTSGTGGEVRINGDFSLGAGDFCISARVATTQYANAPVVLDYYRPGSRGWQVQITNTGGLAFWSSSQFAPVGGVQTFVADGLLHWIDICRAAGFLYFFVDGILQGSPVACDLVLDNINEGVVVGCQQLASGASRGFQYSGGIEEVLITKGTSRHTSNFTPPPVPFPSVQC